MYLSDYAAGSLSEGMSLLVASHLTYCPDCRRKVAGYEAIGAAGLSETQTRDVAAPSLEKALAELDRPDRAPSVQPDSGSPLPAPIRHELGERFDDIGWKFRMPGLHERELSGFAGEHVSLLRVRPGTGMLHHTHEGEEATLILTGIMQDGDRVYRKGDVAMADHNDDHNPRVVGDEVCYCLIVMTGGMKFTGPMGRALNLFRR